MNAHRDPLHGLESLTVAAKRLGRTPGRLRQLCLAGSIKGARKVGRDWYIPDNYEIRPATASNP